MAENENIDNEENEGNKESGKGLRKLFEDALAENVKLKDRLGDLEKQTRKQSLADLFKSSGAKAGADKFYPADADASEEAVKAWIEENAAFVKDEAGSEEGGKPNADEQTVNNSRRLSALTDSANDGIPSDLSDIVTRIEQIDATKPGAAAELQALYDQLGIKHRPS